MRALRVVGVTGDGSVVLEDPGRRERYTVPADEQLRAAARGDVTRLGQIAIELESQLRPREIQARIRGGASVDQVAAAAGVPVQKIERFAYPVLLERSRTAELAQGAHPQRTDGPDLRTLGETVAHTFGLRGQDHTTATWDSWKGDDGKWVVALSWRAGRSDNAAHWAFQPGAHGGTVVALDEHASDLVEGLPARPLRTVGAVVDLGRDEDPETEQPYEPESPQVRAAVAGETRPADRGRGIAPEQRRSSPSSRSTGTRPATGRPSASDFAEEYATRQDTARQDTARQTPPPAAPEPAAASPTTPAASSTPAPAAQQAAPEPAARRATDEGTAADHGTTGSDTDRPVVEPRATGQATAERPAVWDRADRAAPAANRAAAARADAPTGRPSASTPGAGPDASATEPAGSADTEVASTSRPAETVAPGTADRDATASGSGAPGPAEPAASESDAPDAPGADEAAPGRSTGSGNRSAANRRTKKGKPVMPSWDEVLLGVRGQR